MNSDSLSVCICVVSTVKSGFLLFSMVKNAVFLGIREILETITSRLSSFGQFLSLQREMSR